MRYARSVIGGILGTILFLVLCAAIVVVHIERVERAVGAAEEEVELWFQAGGETEGYNVRNKT